MLKDEIERIFEIDSIFEFFKMENYTLPVHTQTVFIKRYPSIDTNELNLLLFSSYFSHQNSYNLTRAHIESMKIL